MARRKTIGSLTVSFVGHEAVSKNKRIYSTEANRYMVRAAQADLAKGVPITSFATHDYAQAEDPTKMVGQWSNVWEEGSKVKAKLDFFDTSHARDLMAVIEGQGLKTVSLRASDFAVAKEKRKLGEDNYDVVDRYRLAGIDFAMRPGLDIAQVESFAFESDQTTGAVRDIVECEGTTVILTEGNGTKEEDMTKEEIQSLIDAALKDKALEASADEAKRHAHAHQHMGGDGKKYTHEHKHAHGEADVDGKDHDHEHGNPYESLGAYSIADLSRALAERSTSYAAEKDMAPALATIAVNLDTTRAALLTAGIIKESENPLATQLTEAVSEKTTLTETITTITTERDDLKAKLEVAEAAKTKAEEEATKLSESIANGLKPHGRRIPLNDVLEQVLATSEVRNPDEEIPSGKEYRNLVRDFASAFVLAADER